MYKPARAFALQLLFVLVSTLVHQISFAQTCGSPTIPAVMGYYTVGWADNQTVVRAAPTLYGTSYLAMQSSMNSELLNALQASAPSCSFSITSSVWSTANYYNQPVLTDIVAAASGCPPLVYPMPDRFSDYLSLHWVCLQSGYQGNQVPGNNVLSSGVCYATNPELMQCGGAGQAGFQGATYPVTSKTDGQCPTCTAGNPVTVATGNKFQLEVDYPATSSDGLSFARFYNSDPYVAQGSVGYNWRDTFDRRIVLSSDPSFNGTYTGPLLAIVYRPDGRVITFNITGSTPVPTDSDTIASLAQVGPSTWVFTDESDTAETYSMVTSVQSSGPVSFGQLQTIQFRTGVTQSMHYDGGQHLTTVTDSFGKALTFTYDSSNRLSSMIDPAGNLFTYAYAASYTGQFLSSVQFPAVSSGTPTRQYSYSQPNQYWMLGAIKDESGNWYAQWTYNSAGQATSSYHGSNQDLVKFAGYSSTPGTGTTVTDGNGRSDVYTFSVINGVPKYTSIKTNSSITASASYDLNGNFTSKTDPLGNVALHVKPDKKRELERETFTA